MRLELWQWKEGKWVLLIPYSWFKHENVFSDCLLTVLTNSCTTACMLDTSCFSSENSLACDMFVGDLAIIWNDSARKISYFGFCRHGYVLAIVVKCLAKFIKVVFAQDVFCQTFDHGVSWRTVSLTCVVRPNQLDANKEAISIVWLHGNQHISLELEQKIKFVVFSMSK